MSTSRAAKSDQIGNRACAYRAGVEFARDHTAFDQHDAARDIEHEFEILLDNEHRKPMLFAQRRQKFADFLDDGWLNTFRRLVEKQKPRQRHEGASQCQNLLLAAR